MKIFSLMREALNRADEARFGTYKDDPRVITVKYPTSCAETGRRIAKGEQCVYYPKGKKCYSMDSKTAADFRSWQFDVGVLGHDY